MRPEEARQRVIRLAIFERRLTRMLEWAAINYSGVTYNNEGDRARHMADYVRSHADTFNPRWTLDHARAEEHEWHAELARNKPVILADRGVD